MLFFSSFRVHEVVVSLRLYLAEMMEDIEYQAERCSDQQRDF